MNILFIFCEGPHDVQFIRRVLIASNEYEAYNDSITQYAPPLADYFSYCITTQNLDAYQIGEPQPTKMPSTSLRSLDHNSLIIFYNMGGDSKVVPTIELLNELFKFVLPDPNLEYYDNQGGDNNYSLLFFYDADSDGIEGRRTTFCGDYHDFFEGLTDFPVESWQVKKGVPIGLFIFTGDGIDEGTLENTIIDLFTQSNRSLVEASKSLLARYSNHREGTVAQRAKKAKSTLTICGQTEEDKAGYSLAVIIKGCAFLDNVFNFNDDSKMWKRILSMVNRAFHG
jgi:hypothetical protein